MPCRSSKPTQFEPMPCDQAARTMDWIARLALETAEGLLSIPTRIASGACAIYGPVGARRPRWCNVALFCTTMKCHGWPFMLLAVRWPASTICRMIGSGMGVSFKSAYCQDRTNRLKCFHECRSLSRFLFLTLRRGSRWRDFLVPTFADRAGDGSTPLEYQPGHLPQVPGVTVGGPLRPP